MKPSIIAHRGASFLAKHENTLEAFQLAIDIGADYVEFDIRKTYDDKLVIFHNESINDKAINALTYKELCRETTADSYKIPLLNEVLELCRGKIKLDIELKEAGYEKQIISMVSALYDYDSYMMKSFIDRAVATIKHINPDINAGLLLGYKNGDIKRRFNEYFPERRLKACNADFVSPHYKLATPAFIRRMHLMRKKVYIWTVNDTNLLEKYISRNADGIITDKPDAGIFIRKSYNI